MVFEKMTLSPIFIGLTADDIKVLLSDIHYDIQSFEKGEILAMQDEPCNRLIILIDGYVKAEMADASAKVVKVEDIYAPNPLAILFLFGKNNRFPVQVTAKEKVSALVIPKTSVLKMLQQNEQVLLNFLNISAMYASMLSKKLHLMSFRTIRQKLAMYFLDLTKPDKMEAELDRTQLALSEYFGVSRPSLARELANMQDDGLIEINKKHVKILNKNKLVQLVSF
ncbi:MULTISPECIES: Crp/Fnr family transcriptional regulator [unclassified Dysgonomonas]|uniref:Crp/Fnr family transcriptional regulator n=1 Tax=unclassified Dysgonomonas TaxID=2630389 RepID=UPI000680464A|nr:MULTISPECIES: Crp/Fnr family transcriptional regulator [unclassified Dysgonomonas]MBD8346400.1 Crp/Fnr family transcriptional regulator [Dysgonomonas sp. HGC4]MBF0574685.1 Crp/Fnr family transcriptional regulator [Dysgonomonas sp. GY617]